MKVRSLSRTGKTAALTSLFAFAASQVFAAAPLLSLDDSVAMALKNQPSVKIAAADEDKANWGIQDAKSGLWPQLSLGASETRGGAVQGISDTLSTGLHLNWALYSGGRLQGQVKQAELSADSAKLGVQKALADARLAATTKYFTVLQTKNMVAVNQEAVSNLTDHLQNVNAQFAAGTIAKQDVLRSEVELANAQQNLTKAQNSYDVAKAALNDAIGSDLSFDYSYQDQLPFEPYTLSLEDSIAMAAQNRPELAQAQNNVTAAEVGEQIANSGRLPTVSLTGSEGWSGKDLDLGNRNWSVGVTASWNLFDAGATKAKAAEAKAASLKAQEQAKQQGNAVELEVRQTYLTMNEAKQRITTSSEAAAKATEDLSIAKVKYAAGAGTNLDVIDAQLALTQAKTNETQARYDYNVAKASLEKAVNLTVDGK
ncbi:MAG: TolC family protein [Sporomusaceae bacterium]|nr:TolC family protein [Sporomusaceae bacterium]